MRCRIGFGFRGNAREAREVTFEEDLLQFGLDSLGIGHCQRLEVFDEVVLDKGGLVGSQRRDVFIQ